MSDFLVLKGDCYFGRGLKRGAIYDLKNGTIYSLDPHMNRLLSVSTEGVAFQEALRRVYGGCGTGECLSQEALALYSPVLSLEKRPGIFPRLERSLTSAQGQRDAVWLEVTNQCNLACIHCYSRAKGAAKGELSLSQWEDIVDQLVTLGWSRFSISGGEPLCWPHLFPFLEYILRDPCRTVSVISNGTLLKGHAVEFLRRKKVPIAITFYSYSQKTHDLMSGNEESWKRTVEGLTHTVDADLQYSVTVPTGSLNRNDRKDTLDFLETLGVKRDLVEFTTVFPLGRGCNKDALPHRRVPFDLRARGSELTMTDEGKLLYGACWAGKLLLKADGEVGLCPLAREGDFIMGNIRNRSLVDILQDPRLKRFWGLSLDDVEGCGECEFRYGCRDCRPAAHMYTGKLHVKDPDCPYEPARGEWKTGSVEEDEMAAVAWIRNGKYAARPLEDDLVLLDERGKAIHLLNRVGAEIWRLLDRHRSIEDIVDQLRACYEVEEEQVRADVTRLLVELERLGIVSSMKG